MATDVDPADLLTNDTDIDGDTLAVTGVSNARGGRSPHGGRVTFTPDANLCGDAAGASTTTSATATVAPTAPA